MSTFTAQELADFYQKVADGGEIEYDALPDGWLPSWGGPDIRSDGRYWRIKPTEKVIDLKLVDARASYEAAYAAALVKYAADLDAALIDSLFAAYKEQAE